VTMPVKRSTYSGAGMKVERDWVFKWRRKVCNDDDEMMFILYTCVYWIWSTKRSWFLVVYDI